LSTKRNFLDSRWSLPSNVLIGGGNDSNTGTVVRENGNPVSSIVIYGSPIKSSGMTKIGNCDTVKQKMGETTRLKRFSRYYRIEKNYDGRFSVISVISFFEESLMGGPHVPVPGEVYW